VRVPAPPDAASWRLRPGAPRRRAVVAGAILVAIGLLEAGPALIEGTGRGFLVDLPLLLLFPAAVNLYLGVGSLLSLRYVVGLGAWVPWVWAVLWALVAVGGWLEGPPVSWVIAAAFLAAHGVAAVLCARALRRDRDDLATTDRLPDVFS
jgi:hypothetical protein